MTSTPVSTTQVGRLVCEATESFVRLAALAADAEAVQWDPSRSIQPREDSPARSSGDISNPTLDTAVDPHRLAVRAAFTEAVRALEDASERASAAARLLEDALAAWAGDPLGTRT